MRKPSPSDLTDEQGEIIRPLIPVHPVGRPREVERREVLNTIFSLNRSGGPWDLLPHDLVPQSTVSDAFAPGRDDGTGPKIRDAVRRQGRTEAGRPPSPSVGCIDRPTVKGTAVGGPGGDDGGPKITGRKRPSRGDTWGWLLVVAVPAASADDGTAAPQVGGPMTAEHCLRLERLGGDQKDRTNSLDDGRERTRAGDTVDVVARPAGSVGSVKWAWRGVVERTFAWMGRERRHSRDDEPFTHSSEAMIKVSSIHRMLRCLKLDKSRRPVPFKYRESQEIITG
jgi:putative transposase